MLYTYVRKIINLYLFGDVICLRISDLFDKCITICFEVLVMHFAHSKLLNTGKNFSWYPDFCFSSKCLRSCRIFRALIRKSDFIIQAFEGMMQSAGWTVNTCTEVKLSSYHFLKNCLNWMIFWNLYFSPQMACQSKDIESLKKLQADLW